MTSDNARLTVLIDADNKQEFQQLCAALGTTPSEVTRALIRDFIAGKRQPAALYQQLQFQSRRSRHRGGGAD